eukprot:470349_1
MENINSQSWIELNAKLTSKKVKLRSVIFNNLIYIVGGEGGRNEVDVINTTTNSITLDSNLITSVDDTSLIVVANTIYAFGGETGSTNTDLNIWQHSYFLTTSPTTNAPTAITITATVTPTSNPTETTNVTTIYAISITMIFQYVVDENDKEQILEIFSYFINNTYTENNANHDCIGDDETFDIEIFSNIENTIVNMTILTCDTVSRNHILKAFANETLQKTLITKADEKGIFIDIEQIEVLIVGDIIFERDAQVLMETSSAPIVHRNTISDKSKHNTTIALIVIAIVIFVCVLIVCAFYVVKMKKEMELKGTTSNMRALQSVSSIENGVALQITNVQTTNGSVTTDGLEKLTNKSTNEIETCYTNATNDFDGTSEDITPGNLNVSSTPKDDVNFEQMELKLWLKHVKVDFEMYYDVFVTNGYESIKFIKELSDVSELKDIGIEVKEHQIELMKAIDELKNQSIIKPEKEGIENSNNGKYHISNVNDDCEVIGDDVTKGQTIGHE